MKPQLGGRELETKRIKTLNFHPNLRNSLIEKYRDKC